jgi:hypothetical protein
MSLWKSFSLLLLLSRYLIPVLIFIPVVLVYLITNQEFEWQYFSFSDSGMKDIFRLVLIDPFIETLIAQYFLIWLFHFLLNRSYLTSILLSGFIFGILHLYGIGFQVIAVLMGITLAFAFVIYKKKYSVLKAICLVWAMHATANLLTLLAHNLLMDLSR